jgi:hypothetical protein
MNDMAEYLIFIHGVNTRDIREQPDYANPLIERIQRRKSPEITLKPVSLYWGDVNIDEEKKLLKDLEDSKAWSKLQFKQFRSKQLLQFVGDAALYISRSVGRKIVDQLIKQLSTGLQDFNPETDHIHLITHSMGTIILFDVLFSSRWDAQNVYEYQGVELLRQHIFQGGTPVRSIHTMGSPIGLFSLMTISDTSLPNTHEITPRLSDYLQALCSKLEAPFPWRNYLHAMDIVATSIEVMLPKMLGESAKDCLDVVDIITQESGILDKLFSRLSANLSLEEVEGEVEAIQLAVFAGSAHSSYWSSSLVASTIMQTVETTLSQRQRQPA